QTCHWTGQYDARKTHIPCPRSSNTATATSIPAHHSADSPSQPDPDIDEGFRLLETNPKRALVATAALSAKYLEDPPRYARVVELVAKALFRR
ncbi:hypothetical protein, partial [Sansalvadorimonas verongulae]|uniref:hypothetical protein n=1 Tax=Sansalvadorimonas verongulae TaxID=2172824 RepID=UPI001E38B066